MVVRRSRPQPEAPLVCKGPASSGKHAEQVRILANESLPLPKSSFCFVGWFLSKMGVFDYEFPSIEMSALDECCGPGCFLRRCVLHKAESSSTAIDFLW